MRLIQNMCTIAEFSGPGSAAEGCLGAAGRRLVKIAVVGASGVGKTGELSRLGRTLLLAGLYVGRPQRELQEEEAELGPQLGATSPSACIRGPFKRDLFARGPCYLVR